MSDPAITPAQPLYFQSDTDWNGDEYLISVTVGRFPTAEAARAFGASASMVRAGDALLLTWQGLTLRAENADVRVRRIDDNSKFFRRDTDYKQVYLPIREFDQHEALNSFEGSSYGVVAVTCEDPKTTHLVILDEGSDKSGEPFSPEELAVFEKLFGKEIAAAFEAHNRE